MKREREMKKRRRVQAAVLFTFEAFEVITAQALKSSVHPLAASSSELCVSKGDALCITHQVLHK